MGFDYYPITHNFIELLLEWQAELEGFHFLFCLVYKYVKVAGLPNRYQY